jgi:hypothetical protein
MKLEPLIAGVPDLPARIFARECLATASRQRNTHIRAIVAAAVTVAVVSHALFYGFEIPAARL